MCWTPTPPGSDGDILGNSFKFFVSYLDAAEKLKPKERGEFLYAVAKYGITGEEIPLRKSLQPLWDVIKPNLEVSRKYQIYGEKGGRPKKPPFEKSESPLSEIQKPNKEENMNKNMNKNMEVDKNTNTDYSAADAASEGATQQDRQNIFAEFAGEDADPADCKADSGQQLSCPVWWYRDPRGQNHTVSVERGKPQAVLGVATSYSDMGGFT